MAKKSESFLSPKKVLNREQYKQYKESKIAAKRLALLQKTRQTQEYLPTAERQERYQATKSGAVGRGIAGIFRAIQSPSRVLNKPVHQFGRKTQRQTTYGRYTSRPGRPMGTYNKLYAQYGGVYGWRKAMAQKRRLEQLEYLRSIARTPGQQAAFRSIAARRAEEDRMREAAPIPVTQGNVPLRGLMDEIDAATQIVN